MSKNINDFGESVKLPTIDIKNKTYTFCEFSLGHIFEAIRAFGRPFVDAILTYYSAELGGADQEASAVKRNASAIWALAYGAAENEKKIYEFFGKVLSAPPKTVEAFPLECWPELFEALVSHPQFGVFAGKFSRLLSNPEAQKLMDK